MDSNLKEKDNLTRLDYVHIILLFYEHSIIIKPLLNINLILYGIKSYF